MMRLTWPWSKQKQIDCPGGRTVFVYRHVDDAFPLQLSSHQKGLDASIDAVNHIKSKLSATNKQKIEHLLVSINSTNANLQNEFRSSYIVYSSDPCANGDYLAKSIDRANENYRKIQRAQLLLTNLLQFLTTKTVDSALQTTFAEQVGAILRTIHDPSQLLVEEMKQVETHTEEWQQ